MVPVAQPAHRFGPSLGFVLRRRFQHKRPQPRPRSVAIRRVLSLDGENSAGALALSHRRLLLPLHCAFITATALTAVPIRIAVHAVLVARRVRLSAVLPQRRWLISLAILLRLPKHGRHTVPKVAPAASPRSAEAVIVVKSTAAARRVIAVVAFVLSVVGFLLLFGEHLLGLAHLLQLFLLLLRPREAVLACTKGLGTRLVGCVGCGWGCLGVAG
mmetsp:Transcript_37619/g.102053  ORF Transcript_37619/g.102053 Transcript_37619/m.102053 type:complete len:215 (+) Transcript_37619:4097-4741(+)